MCIVFIEQKGVSGGLRIGGRTGPIIPPASYNGESIGIFRTIQGIRSREEQLRSVYLADEGHPGFRRFGIHDPFSFFAGSDGVVYKILEVADIRHMPQSLEVYVGGIVFRHELLRPSVFYLVAQVPRLIEIVVVLNARVIAEGPQKGIAPGLAESEV